MVECATGNVIQNGMPHGLLNKSHHQNHILILNSRCDLVAEKPEEKRGGGGKKAFFWLLSVLIINSVFLLTVQHGGFIERCLVTANRHSVFIFQAGWLSVKLVFGGIPVVMWIWCRKWEAVLAIGVKHSCTQ